MRKIFVAFICILSILGCCFFGCSNGAVPTTHKFTTEEELKSFMIEKVEFDREKEYYLFDLSCLSNVSFSEEQSIVLSIIHQGKYPETCEDVFEGLGVENITYKDVVLCIIITVGFTFDDDFKPETEARTEEGKPCYGLIVETTEIQPIVIEGMQGDVQKYTRVDEREEWYSVRVYYNLQVYQEDSGTLFCFKYEQGFVVSNEDFELTGEYKPKGVELITYDEVISLATQAIQSRYVIVFEEEVIEEELSEGEV